MKINCTIEGVVSVNIYMKTNVIIWKVITNALQYSCWIHEEMIRLNKYQNNFNLVQEILTTKQSTQWWKHM